MSQEDYSQNGGGAGSESFKGEEPQSKISYVKHLSSKQDAPGQGGDSSGGGGGFVASIPGGWWTIGIGAATVIIGILALNKMGSKNGNANASGLQSGAYYPYGTNSNTGGSQDTSHSVAGAMDQQLTGLLGQEQINNQVLQAILGNLSNPVTPTSPTINAQTVMPWEKGHAGASNNFWTYVTQQGDTMNSLNARAGWGPLGSLGQVGNNVDQYRNNGDIFRQIGITNPNQTIAPGTKVSL